MSQSKCSQSYFRTFDVWWFLQHNIPIKHEARQLQESDFTTFTHILASDANNLKNALSIKPANCTAVVRLWGSYLDNEPIPDPYYGRTVRQPVLQHVILLIFYIAGWIREMLRTMCQAIKCILRPYNTWSKLIETSYMCFLLNTDLVTLKCVWLESGEGINS